ncbi:MAG TPA: hypothetical protein VES67_26355 [Vicinamibacterales bacterium]|nr:hypothetical protein [Vicinamibacterales bacterium]
MRRLICGLAVVVLTSGCASFSPPIRLDTTPADAEILAGEWHGNYLAEDPPGRRGTIVFKLVAGEDHAHGSVLMIPEGSTRAYERYHGDAPVSSRQAAAPSQVLTIRFVRAADGEVTGQLDPYWDPDRECPATTTFRGAIGDGVIAGTFTTRLGTGVTEATGRWRVVRSAPRPPSF